MGWEGEEGRRVTGDDAGGPVAAVEALVERVAGLLARRQPLFHRVVRHHRENPSAHFLAVVLHGNGMPAKRVSDSNDRKRNGRTSLSR